MALPARTRRTRALPQARYPLSVEMAYLAILRGIVREWGKVAMEEWDRNADRILSELRQSNSDEAIRTDTTGWAAVFFNMLLSIADRMAMTLFEGLNKISSISGQVNAVSKKEWNKQVRAAYGVDILRGEPKLADMLSAWEAENLALIKSLPENMTARLRGVMMKAFHEGAGLRDLTKLVRETTGAGEKRAELIARDQIGKLNGQLAEMRQTSIGVEEYIWRTSQDERVRPTHRVRNGKTYKWSDKGIRPGSEIRCRCNAEPIFPEEFGTSVKRLR